MLPRGEVFTPTDTVPFLINTADLDSGEAATWSSGSIRLMRYRAGAWTEITDSVGYTLDTDWSGGTPRDGLHVGSVDLDGLTSPAAGGDLFAIIAAGGTVATNNIINLALAYFWVQIDGLTEAQAAAIAAQAGAALADYDAVTASDLGIITSDVNDVSAEPHDFQVTANTGTDIRIGTLRFTSGALAGESRIVKHEGQNIRVLPVSALTGLPNMEAFSAAPADNDTFIFVPL